MIEDPAAVVIAGDWHGNTAWALRMLGVCADQNVSVLVHLGDFGFWPGRKGREYLDAVEAALESTDQILYWIDGNHEDHDALDAWPVEQDGTHRIRDRIFHLPRGFRWTWQGRSWMALGGAHSVDRNHRTPYVDWWPREFLSPDEVQRAIDGGAVDVMVCHDAPLGADVPVLRLGPKGWQPEEIAMSVRHQRLIREVVDAVRPVHLWHGHYHDRYEGVLRLDDGHVVKVHGLSCDGTSADDNLVAVDLAVPWDGG